MLPGVLPMSLAPVFATAFGRGYQLASLPQYYTYAGAPLQCANVTVALFNSRQLFLVEKFVDWRELSVLTYLFRCIWLNIKMVK